jgi:hypothetical protein
MVVANASLGDTLVHLIGRVDVVYQANMLAEFFLMVDLGALPTEDFDRIEEAWKKLPYRDVHDVLGVIAQKKAQTERAYEDSMLR